MAASALISRAASSFGSGAYCSGAAMRWPSVRAQRRNATRVLRGAGFGPLAGTRNRALESRGHFRLAHASGEIPPVRRGEMGKVAQVGDDLLPRTGAGADVLDQLPVCGKPARFGFNPITRKSRAWPRLRRLASTARLCALGLFLKLSLGGLDGFVPWNDRVDVGHLE